VCCFFASAHRRLTMTIDDVFFCLLRNGTNSHVIVAIFVVKDVY
jgi:hypothetical protein